MRFFLYFALFLIVVQLCLCNADSSSEDESSEENNNDGQRGAGIRAHPCDLECRYIQNPRRRVCGSDGITYLTHCWLKHARCTNKNLRFVRRGDCPEPTTETTSQSSPESTFSTQPV